MRRSTALGLAVLCSVGGACRGRSTDAAPAVRAIALRPQFAGCAVVYVGPRCALGSARELTFWVEGAGGARASWAKAELPLTRTRVEGGEQLRVNVPRDATWIELSATDGARWRLPIEPHLPAAELERAQTLRKQGQLEQARAVIAAAMPQLTEAERARGVALLARIALAEGHAAEAVDGLSQSMLHALGAGRISDAIYDATALAYVLAYRTRDYTRARAVLERMQSVAAQDPAGAALLPHYAGLIARETGQLRAALALFREAALRTQRLGLREHHSLALELLASSLATLGRHDEAIALQRSAVTEAAEADACQRADRGAALIWFVLLAHPNPNTPLAELGKEAARDVRAALAGCPGPWRLRNHLINEGLLALQLARLDDAAAVLGELERVSGGQDMLLATWQAELSGRYALAIQKPKDALPHFQRALELARRADLWESEQLAQLGLARCEAALGRSALAVAAYGAAQDRLDALSSVLPLQEGRAGFLNEREAGTRELLTLLIEHGQEDEALRSARHARARLIASDAAFATLDNLAPAARAQWERAIARYRSERAQLEREHADAWKLPTDALAAREASLATRRRATLAILEDAYAGLPSSPGLRAGALEELAPDEALLGYFPTQSGWFGFCQRRGVTFARRLASTDESAPPAADGGGLLQPFASCLAEAVRVRIVAHSALASLDFHALALSGRPLIAASEVVYGLDRPGAVREAGAARGALIVADPKADLPAAAREGALLSQLPALRSAQLLSGARATRSAVLAGLEGKALFHYAGHAGFAGLEGMESGLSLADGAVRVTDLLTLSRAPRLVVLSACEAARGDGPGFAGGVGVAHALIAAGAEAVVAPTRPVADRAAQQLMAAFYAAYAGEPSQAAAALRVAQRAQLSAAGADWASFRVLVP